jgi:hypothetical protein
VCFGACVLLLLGLTRLAWTWSPFPATLHKHTHTCAAREEKVSKVQLPAAVLRGLRSSHTRDAARSGERVVEIFSRGSSSGRRVRIDYVYWSQPTDAPHPSIFPSFADRDIPGIETTSHHRTYRSLCCQHRRQLLRRRRGRGTIDLEAASTPRGLDLTPLLVYLGYALIGIPRPPNASHR